MLRCCRDGSSSELRRDDITLGVGVALVDTVRVVPPHPLHPPHSIAPIQSRRHRREPRIRRDLRQFHFGAPVDQNLPKPTTQPTKIVGLVYSLQEARQTEVHSGVDENRPKPSRTDHPKRVEPKASQLESIHLMG